MKVVLVLLEGPRTLGKSLPSPSLLCNVRGGIRDLLKEVLSNVNIL